MKKRGFGRRAAILLAGILAGPWTGAKACGPSLPFGLESPLAVAVGLAAGTPLFVVGYAFGAAICLPWGIVHAARGKGVLEPAASCGAVTGWGLGLLGYGAAAAPLGLLSQSVPSDF